MSLAGLVHRNNYLCRKLTQIHSALDRKDKQHGSSYDRAQLPLLTLPLSFMKMDSGGEVEIVDFTHTSSVPGLPACSDLRIISCVEGTWRKREAFKKDLSTRRAFHLASARSLSMVVNISSCSQIYCQVQNCVTKVEQMDQWGLVGFLHLKCKEVFIMRYFLAVSN